MKAEREARRAVQRWTPQPSASTADEVVSASTADEVVQTSKRMRPIARALAAFNPALPRVGRVQRQAKRCLIVHDGSATMTQLKAWCYAGRKHRHWQYEVIREALARLGAKQIGRAGGIGRPAIWALRGHN